MASRPCITAVLRSPVGVHRAKKPAASEREAAAARWESVDLAVIAEEELEEVPVTVAKEPTITFSVRLSRDDVNRIRAAAQARGVGPTELARAWVLEALSREVADAPSPEGALDRVRASLNELEVALRHRGAA